jgi:hypothetical protein
MAERRMFTDKITESDVFLDMPLSTQALYFHFCMNADDDGFVKNPKRIQRMLGAGDDDCKLLVVKRFVLPFESGVIVIKHWRMHNLLRKDRYKPTEYIEEKSMLKIKENGAYTFDETQGKSLMATSWQPDDNQLATQDSIGKDSIDKYIKENKKENPFEGFEFTEKVKSMIHVWLGYKKEKGQTYKPVGLNTLLKKIEKWQKEFGEDYVVNAIDNSISNNYTGLFPVKTNGNQKPKESFKSREYTTDELNGVYDSLDDVELE